MFGKPKPSEYLRRHLAGEGFALDDLVSRHQGDAAYQDVIDAVTKMLANPNERGEFEALAQKLETEGR